RVIHQLETSVRQLGFEQISETVPRQGHDARGRSSLREEVVARVESYAVQNMQTVSLSKTTARGDGILQDARYDESAGEIHTQEGQEGPWVGPFAGVCEKVEDQVLLFTPQGRATIDQ